MTRVDTLRGVPGFRHPSCSTAPGSLLYSVWSLKGDALMHADVLRAINVQINSEFGAWYQYLAMAAFCEREQFVGAGKWLQAQSDEEYQHGMKLFNFLLARNGAVELTALEQPKREFESFGEVFEAALKQEMRVTEEINSLYELCFKSKAFAEMT